SAKRKVLSSLRSNDPLNDPLPEIKENSTLSKLKDQYADQNAKLLEMKGRYLDRHPALLAQQARLDAVRQEIHHEAQLSTKSLDSETNLAAETEKTLLASLEEAKRLALEVNKKQIEYDRLKRSADNNAKLYDLVLARLKESDLAGQLRTNNVRLLDRAQT